MTRPVQDPRLAPLSSPTIDVLEALRDMFSARLGLPRRLIGGWEVVAMRDATLAVYTNGGTDSRGAGGQVTRTSEELSVVFIARSGSPIHEAQLYPVRDAVRQLLVQFTHPALAGLSEPTWTFDIRRDGGFTNILTVKARLDYRSRPVALRGEDDTFLGSVRGIILDLIQDPAGTAGQEAP